MKKYRYYLFDADGTLLDSTELIYQSFAFACREFAGYDLGREEVTRHLGTSVRQQFELYLGPLSDEDYRRIYQAQLEFQLRQYKQYLSLFPGVIDTLTVLKSRGKQLAIVSARKQESLLIYLRETAIHDLFDAIVSPELTNGANKPEPAPALKALELMSGNGNVKQALFVGDVASDIECGQRAGMDTAFVAWSERALDSLSHPPTMILKDIRDLVTDGHNR